MLQQGSRISWDTTVKHYIRSGLYDNLPDDLKVKVSRANKHRWERESVNKYVGCDVAKFISEELELIKRVGQSQKAKKVIGAYFKLSDAYHEIVGSVKIIRQKVAEQKEKIVNTIEAVKNTVSIESALKIFNISRSTYQNYKTFVINKCDGSYFLWCVKKYPHQLLKKEILQIKKYMEDQDYRYWSKTSIYLLAIRNKDISIGLTTWYKYCKLLGFNSSRRSQFKKVYSSLKSYKPNEIWCTDVTILKTLDNQKHYIHFLIDHYSKKVLGFSVVNSSSPVAIKNLLQQAYLRHKGNKPITLVTDGGVENVNTTVKDFLNTRDVDIKHLIAQKDIPFSNSKIEAFNKIIKHQFLLPQNLENREQLEVALIKVIPIYNGVRPQFSLKGNTPNETFEGKTIDFDNYNSHFLQHIAFRIAQNQQNSCKKCSF